MRASRRLSRSAYRGSCWRCSSPSFHSSRTISDSATPSSLHRRRNFDRRRCGQCPRRTTREGHVEPDHAAHRVVRIAVGAAVIALATSTPAFLAAFALYGIGLGIVDAAAKMQAVSIQQRLRPGDPLVVPCSWSVGAIVGAGYVAACSALELSVELSVLVAAAAVAALCAGIGPRLLRTGHERAATSVTAPLTVPLRPFLALGVAMMLFYAIDFGIGTYSPLYLKEVLLSDAGTAALAMGAYQVTALISRLTGDHWVRRFGEIAVVRVGAAISVAGLLIAVLAPSPAVAIAGFFIVGLGAPVIAPLSFSAAGRLAPPDQTDAVIARINLFNYAGTVIAGGVIGGIAALSDSGSDSSLLCCSRWCCSCSRPLSRPPGRDPGTPRASPLPPARDRGRPESGVLTGTDPTYAR
ncbi:MFS transporter [Rhodococcus hoagii]|nr:MFS transporter [Prescottella equi]